LPDLRISELPDGTTAQATDVIPIVRGGENYRLPLSAGLLPAASDTQVLFKDGTGVGVSGSADFVFNKTLKTLAVTGQLTATALAIGTVPLVAKAFAGQTAALQEWQNSSGVALSVVDALGRVGVLTATPSANLEVANPTGSTVERLLYATNQNISSANQAKSLFLAVGDGSAYAPGLGIIGAVSGTGAVKTFLTLDAWVGSEAISCGQDFGIANNKALRSSSTGIGANVGLLTFTAANVLKVGPDYPQAYGLDFIIGNDATTFRWITNSGNTELATLSGKGALRVVSLDAAVIPLAAKAHATQTANLQEWQNSGGTALAAITKDGYLKVGANQVVSTRKTGWTAPTGTPTRTTFDTATVTLPQLAERVKALVDDLQAHGLIGS